MDIISVIIPVYRIEQLLDKCIQSVVEQTYPALEIILVDDGSPDRCGEICDQWVEKDSRVQVIHKTNGGLSNARNAGLDAASSQYIGFVDSDDYIHPDMYRLLYQCAVQNNADIAVCGYIKTDVAGVSDSKSGFCPQNNHIVDKWVVLKDIERTVAIQAWNKLYKRLVFGELRFPGGKINEDAFLMHHLIYNSNTIVTIDRQLYFYIQRPQSIMRSPATIRSFDAIEALYQRILFLEMLGFWDCLPKLTNRMFFRYIRTKKEIDIQTKEEIRRLIEIMNMVRTCLKKYGQAISRRQKLRFEINRIFTYSKSCVFSISLKNFQKLKSSNLL